MYHKSHFFMENKTMGTRKMINKEEFLEKLKDDEYAPGWQVIIKILVISMFMRKMRKKMLKWDRFLMESLLKHEEISYAYFFHS